MTVRETIPGHDLGANYLTPEEDVRRRGLLEAALGYAKRGFQVIPVRWLDDGGACSCHQGASCTSVGKHPVHDDWPNVATADIETVESWWRPSPAENLPAEWWPRANVGIVTGSGSGTFVLDVDLKRDEHGKTGEDTLVKLEVKHGNLPETRVHSTGSAALTTSSVTPASPFTTARATAWDGAWTSEATGALSSPRPR